MKSALLNMVPAVTQMVKTILWLIVALTIGCTKKPVEGYRVMSFDSRTGQWIFLRNGTFDGKYLTKRITAECYCHEWGIQEVRGRYACSLQIGSFLAPRSEKDEKGSVKTILNIYESADYLSIIEGDGDTRVRQEFTILKNEVLQE